MISIGIDPGWASFGISVLDTSQPLSYKGSASFVPKEFPSLLEFGEAVGAFIADTVGDSWTTNFQVHIERFVPYAGCPSAASEMTNIVIGYLTGLFYLLSTGTRKGDNLVVRHRAIDWKPVVCKDLVRTKNFSNPAASFDKKFSIAAAQEISGLALKNDHIADAICLSFLGVIHARRPKAPKG